MWRCKKTDDLNLKKWEYMRKVKPTTRKLKPVKKSKKKSVKYDNSRRSEKSVETQRLVLKSMVSLLVKKRGGEVQIDEIARKSGISERSIFRFFKDKKALMEATDEYVMSYVQSTMMKIPTTCVSEFAKIVFKIFDENERLMAAYLNSTFGYTARTRLRKKMNVLLVESLTKEKKIALTAENRVKVALIVSMVNAKLWEDLRNEFSLTGEEIGEVVAWAINRLSAELS